MKKLILFVCSFVLVLISFTAKCTVVNAEDNVVEETSSTDSSENIYVMDMIEPTVIESEKDSSDRYQKVTFSGDTDTIMIPITFQTVGGFRFTTKGSDQFVSMFTCLYSDKENQNYLGGIMLYTSDTKKSKAYYIDKPGTYYLRLNVEKELNVNEDIDFDLTTEFIPIGERTIEAGITYFAYQQDVFDHESSEIAENYFKFTVPETDIVTVTYTFDPVYNDIYSGSITVLDEKRKEISDSLPVGYNAPLSDYKASTYEQTLVLTKGTYYLKADVPFGVYSINLAMEAASDATTHTAKTAKTMKPGKTYKDICILTDKTNLIDYYKYTIAEKKEIAITLEFKFTGNIIFDFCDKNGKTIPVDYRYTANNTILFTSAERLPKGTYYIKIYKKEKSSCGWLAFSIK